MDSEARLEEFIDKYDERIAALYRRALARVKPLVPGAALLVYDNYNALGVGFAPSDKASDVVLSVVAYPRWITLFFLKGAGLPDREGLLEGTGSTVRSIRLDDELSRLDDPGVLGLIEAAIERSEPPFDPSVEQRLIIRSVSARQRPRRTAARSEPRSSASRSARQQGSPI